MDDWQNLIFVKLSFFLNLTLNRVKAEFKKNTKQTKGRF
ncbi:hypothetical protein [uncultured Gammaproteobacteria bacterium]|nr:hypothetical protein BROOK1789B_781 [Bathymodiolus brooksi thiotrophic gill symbiont]CAC9582202.1 hypothetical protein [uncultured Gammaproteobacteria bacterium]CAC9622658.1 hypothetical protein [uncultured Gammaproteobacteria bacterium]